MNSVVLPDLGEQSTQEQRLATLAKQMSQDRYKTLAIEHLRLNSLRHFTTSVSRYQKEISAC